MSIIHWYADGPEMIETARATNRIIQIGSQRVDHLCQGKGTARFGGHRSAQHGDRALGSQFVDRRVE
jgi:hypothetical protein